MAELTDLTIPFRACSYAVNKVYDIHLHRATVNEWEKRDTEEVKTPRALLHMRQEEYTRLRIMSRRQQSQVRSPRQLLVGKCVMVSAACCGITRPLGRGCFEMISFDLARRGNAGSSNLPHRPSIVCVRLDDSVQNFWQMASVSNNVVLANSKPGCPGPPAVVSRVLPTGLGCVVTVCGSSSLMTDEAVDILV